MFFPIRYFAFHKGVTKALQYFFEQNVALQLAVQFQLLNKTETDSFNFLHQIPQTCFLSTVDERQQLLCNDDGWNDGSINTTHLQEKFTLMF